MTNDQGQDDNLEGSSQRSDTRSQLAFLTNLRLESSVAVRQPRDRYRKLPKEDLDVIAITWLKYLSPNK